MTFLAILLIGIDLRPVEAQAPPSEDIDSLVRAEMTRNRVAGLRIAVIQGGDTVLQESYGMADLEHGVPVRPETVFQIASVSKQFTAAALLLLAERGALSLDDDVREHLPELEIEEGAAVTLRQMLRHTSGIPNLYDLDAWPDIRPLRLPRAPTRALILDALADTPLDFPPGTEWRYSNTGYDLLADIVEQVTGRPFQEFIVEELAAPLGLESTDLCPWERIVPHRARGYETAGDGYANAFRISQSVLFGSGGLCSTSRDLLRWNEALHGGEVLDSTSYRAMTTPAGASTSYGLGLYVADVEGHPVLRHNGSVPGFSSQLEYFPDADLSVVVLANSAAAVAGLAEDAARLTLRLPPRPIPTPPEGWRTTLVSGRSGPVAAHFRTMGAGMHVTASEAGLYFHPDTVLTGQGRVDATFIRISGPGEDEGLGLLLGGRDLGTEAARHLAFLIDASGSFALLEHDASGERSLVPWTQHPAVIPGVDARNRLSVSLADGVMTLSANDRMVTTFNVDAEGLAVSGIAGLRIGSHTDVHIAGFGIASGAAPDGDSSRSAGPPARRRNLHGPGFNVSSATIERNPVGHIVPR